MIRVGKTGVKLTASLLRWALRQYLEQSKHPHGKQTVKQLVRQGDGVKNIEITDKNIKSFDRVARKYGIYFALKKNISKGEYLVFFKAKDEAAFAAALTEYAAKTIHRGNENPSLLAQLEHFKDQANQQLSPERHRQQGEIGL